ncbi:hypothetical protein L227DRAFT_603058 [Lentinus tigrinus ALCF2SS1-6]|uniref:Uncharacterized protein n=1 Tax=Lentinus tigrinus ALCF2SS1-6 TaxID=1328759 RepID=A0A5C2RZF6_9APHY|nr:hypothetical protein L227DRAFT_603058 [Lentinus tigrinus ALCF2SS1-6]
MLRNLLAYYLALHPETVQGVRLLCWPDIEPPTGGCKSLFGIFKRWGCNDYGAAGCCQLGEEHPGKARGGLRAYDVSNRRILPALDRRQEGRRSLLPRRRRRAQVSRQVEDVLRDGVTQHREAFARVEVARLDTPHAAAEVANTQCLFLGAGTLGCHIVACTLIMHADLDRMHKDDAHLGQRAAQNGKYGSARATVARRAAETVRYLKYSHAHVTCTGSSCHYRSGEWAYPLLPEHDARDRSLRSHGRTPDYAATRSSIVPTELWRPVPTSP